MLEGSRVVYSLGLLELLQLGHKGFHSNLSVDHIVSRTDIHSLIGLLLFTHHCV